MPFEQCQTQIDIFAVTYLNNNFYWMYVSSKKSINWIKETICWIRLDTEYCFHLLISEKIFSLLALPLMKLFILGPLGAITFCLTQVSTNISTFFSWPAITGSVKLSTASTISIVFETTYWFSLQLKLVTLRSQTSEEGGGISWFSNNN